MSESTDDVLLARLRYGRVFLFLGFDYLFDIYKFNPVLRFISENLNEEINNYNDIFQRGDAINAENNFRRIKHNIDSIPTNNALDIISLIKWNAVYTSSVDDLILNRLKTLSRVTRPICSADKPYSYSRSELCVFYLFGLYSRSDESEKIPSSRVEYLRRKNESLLMFNNLVDSLSPLDTLIISGWRPDSDPVSSENMYQVISKLSQNQTYIFGQDDVFHDDLINTLINENKITNAGKSLPDFISLNEKNILDLSEYSDELDSFIRVKDRPLEIPIRLRRSLNNYGEIVEDKFFYGIDENHNKNELLRDFLYESSRTPVWNAYPLKLDFEREHFSDLLKLVLDELKKNKVSESPIILHGATGTGKSISIARLCYTLYDLNKYVIIHINNQVDTLDYKIIDDVCEWAESMDGLITVICWDGMSSIDTYQNLSSFLSSRGRKQLVIGTTYKDDSPKSKRYVNAPEQFTHRENTAFLKYLHKNNIPLGTESISFNSVFLVTLYRLLPETRFSITSGVVNEANHIKQVLSNKLTRIDSCENVIAEAFRKVLGKDNSFLSTYSNLDNKVNISDVIDIVMIFGKSGIETPLDLIIRVHPALRLTNLGEAFKSVDIIRWSESKFGDINLSPRNTLEAIIYCKRILPTRRVHIDKLLSVISCIEQKTLYNSMEINFCTDIVKAFGPNGPSGREYQEFYLDISREIGTLLYTKKIDSPRLMLSQANLLREYGKRKYTDTSIFYQDYYDLLQEALMVIEKAIFLEQKKEHPFHKQFSYTLIALYGEKGSILGTLANQCSNDNKDYKIISRYITEAINTLKESFKYNITNYLSLDSIAWIVMNYSKSSVSPEAEKLKFLLDAVSIFSEYNVEDLEERYKSDFLQRKTDLYKKIGNEYISTKTLEQLRSISTEDYHYYNLTKLTSNINENLDSDAIALLKQAMDYIDKNQDECLISYKIAVLHLRLFWLLENSVPMLKGERVVIKKDDIFWEKIVSLTERIQSLSQNNNIIIYLYLKAVALFHLGNYKDSDDLFKKLFRNSDSISGSRRVFKSFLMANKNGIRKFSGEIVNLDIIRNRGEIYIDEINTKITILPSDFGLSNNDKGAFLNDFHIAFNFLNPVADNEKFYKGHL